LNSKDEQDVRVLSGRFIRLGRWLLLLLCLVAGILLWIREISIGFSIILLLAALWLLFDNPLEHFTKVWVRDSSEADRQLDDEEDFADFSQMEPVVLGPSDTLDLHTFSPKELPSLLEEFIRQSQEAENYLVKIIHGKGTGALRRRVHGLLAHDSRVANFYSAPPKSGGWGATVVELKAHQEGEDDKVTNGNQK